MKKMKKLLSMLLAVVMVLAMAAPSFAADGGSITITNATKNNTYFAYKLFEATLNDDNSAIAYTATFDQISKLVPDAMEGADKIENDYFVFNKIPSENEKYSVVKKTDADDTELTNWLGSFFEYTEVKDAEDKVTSYRWEPTVTGLFSDAVEIPNKDGANEISKDGLSYGYYFVTSSLGTVITITSTNKDAVVIDKNQSGPTTLDKKILDGKDEDGKDIEKEKISANFGDVVEYKVTVNTTNYDHNDPISYYYVRDRLATGMSYVFTEKEGKKYVDGLQVFVGETLLAEDKYTLHEITTEEGYTSFYVTIPWSTAKKDADGNLTKDVEFLTNALSSDTITLRYKVTVDTDAVIAGDGNKNYADYNYDTWAPNPDNPDNPEEPKKPDNWKEEHFTTVYTYALAIRKTDNNDQPLKDAIFTLTDKNNNEIHFTTTDVDGVYEVDGTATSNTTQVISPDNGIIVIKGIKGIEEAVNDEYILKEVAAPNGYNLLTETVSLKPIFDSQKTYTQKITYNKDENGNITSTTVETLETAVSGVEAPDYVISLLQTVENVAGTLLPSTGGIGTTIFYAAGIILMAGAVFFVVRRKKA